MKTMYIFIWRTQKQPRNNKQKVGTEGRNINWQTG